MPYDVLSDDEDMEASESAFCGGSNPTQDISTSIDNALPSGIERRGLTHHVDAWYEQGHKASFLKTLRCMLVTNVLHTYY